jgi:hypothetical protein
MYSTVNEFDVANAYYALFLIVFGTISNICCFIVCSQKELKNTFMFSIYRFLFISDTMSLYTWNLGTVIYGLSGHIIESGGTLVCGLFSWFTFLTLQWSAWLLVIITVERYFYLKYRHSSITKLIDNNAKCIALIMGLVLASINALMFIVFLTNSPWSFSNFDFLRNSSYEFWSRIHLFIFFTIPAFCMVLFSLLTAFEIFNQRKRVSSTELQDDLKRISILMLLFVLAFLVLTAPHSILNFFIRRVSLIPNLITIINAVQSLQFTLNASNIFIMCTNKTFRKAARKVRNNLVGIAEK